MSYPSGDTPVEKMPKPVDPGPAGTGEPETRVLGFFTWRDLADLREALRYERYDAPPEKGARLDALEAKLAKLHQALPNPLDERWRT